MNTPFLKKYQPLFYKDFVIDKDYIDLLKTLIEMDNLNILLIGNNGSVKLHLLKQLLENITIPKLFHKITFL